METTPEVDRNPARTKKQVFLQIENSDAWDGEFKEFKEEAWQGCSNMSICWKCRNKSYC